MEPFDTIIEYLTCGKGGTLATIISRVGATPRGAGAKVFVGDDGKIYGTIGGGCVEAEVWHHARSVAKQGVARKLRYALNGKTVLDEGMICGGTVELFLEPVTAKHAEVYKKIFECFSGSERALTITSTEDLPFTKTLITENGRTVGDPLQTDFTKEEFERLLCSPSPSVKDGLVIEAVVPFPCLYVYGAGHISQYISRMAKTVDFHVTIVDDRESFANREKFPEADEVIVEEFKDDFDTMRPLPNGYVVIVTRGHKHDAVVLEGVLKKPPRYIGMIGSKRKVKILFDDLRGKGIAEDLLRTVHAPIGIDIGADTPQEIAISIVAELIKVRRSTTT
ncbi:MAG: putative xanthine dehydrogenase subunit A [Syntrophorhabdus sp. PtaU1.Bin050]|nr:MAG: putative xanthine dehydrogenase subunit A [Syntrophorhabdus sp. PtaU1.Bin050]